jgi:hypothetical protein
MSYQIGKVLENSMFDKYNWSLGSSSNLLHKLVLPLLEAYLNYCLLVTKNILQSDIVTNLILA